MHTMDCTDAATTGILSPHVLPVEDLQEMLIYMEAVLPSTMHLPVSLDDTLHFYRYLHTHVLVAEEQFLLLIDVPIQDRAQQLKIYQVLNLLIPKGKMSACYNIDTKYLGISYDEIKAIEILEQQFTTCQQANRQFCNTDTPLQPLANPPLCITAIYAKHKVGIECQCSLQIGNRHSATIPTPITSNLWILTSTSESDPAGITIIYPDKAENSIKVQKPINVFPLVQHLNTSIYHLTTKIIE